MSTRRFSHPDPELDEFYAQLGEADLQPLWELHGLLTPEPHVATWPFRWAAADLHRLARRGGELVGIDRGGDRRVLACANPGLDGAPYATNTMWAAVQYLNAGEVAPAHRHSPAALRFVLGGSGVWTLVNGDALHMSRGDLVLTPSMTFHQHHNPGDAAMTWMDVLDLPIVAGLDAVFFENGPSEEVDARSDPASESERWFGAAAGLLPAMTTKQERGASRHSPLLAYRWEHTDAALDAQLEVTGLGHAVLRYSNPRTGADVMPTMRCEMTRVQAGEQSVTVRQTGSRVATVLDGAGTAQIGDRSFELASGDIVVVPSWTDFTLHADTRLDVFSTTDAPVLEALGLYRESRTNQ